jgi:polyferredoxin
MQWKERSKLLVLMALQLLWGLILWFSISKYGLGVSTDAVHMPFGGLNLTSGTDVYLLWIELIPEDYYYRPADVEAIADVEPLFTSDAGSVYQVRPKAPQ